MEFDGNAHTVTLARVYAAQGLWEKAADIYRHLLRQQPESRDLRAALAAAEAQLEASAVRRVDELNPLIRQWFDLHSRCAKLRKLKKMKGLLGPRSPA